ncbi:hypothetical protein [Catelliglobosispora koreensis]
MLHGGGQTRHSWRAAGPLLSDAGWDTYAVDARGRPSGDGKSWRARSRSG